MGWVDADAHVVESPLTWDYLTPSEKSFGPSCSSRRTTTKSALGDRRQNPRLVSVHL